MSIRNVEWGEPLLQRAKVPELEAIARKGGPVAGGSAFFGGVPWVYLTCVRLNRRLLSRVVLDHDLADLTGLVVSQDNSCRYCFAVHRALLRTVGFSEERITGLEETLLLADLSSADRAALGFAQRLSRSHPLISPADVEPLRSEGFSELGIKELALTAGLSVFFNRISTMGALPAENWEAFPDRWQNRITRPLARLFVKRLRRRSPEVALRPDQMGGPFSALVKSLDGHPFAGELHGILDEMLAPTALSRRAKALCVAVVARALGCGRSEQEACRIVLEEGLSPEELEDVLQNLASPALDDVESLLVPYSRQTVWYQVPDLQRRTHELASKLAPDALLEAIVVTSFANTLCRLGFLAELE